MKIRVGTLAFLTMLTACQTTTGGLGAQRTEPPAGQSHPPVSRGATDNLALGHQLMAAGRYDQALDAYIRATGRYGLTAELLSAMGSANLKLGRLHEARKLLEIAVKRDPKSVPAWNNLGVVLMELGQDGEARRAFRIAYGLDNGSSDLIRKNLRISIAKMKNPSYDADNNKKYSLVRRGNGQYLLLRASGGNVEQ
ncbi:MAG: tetratricopeptide repeat protein [Paracoccaceae bacterium]|nr:tetratricopeptide repeat protein [Paracoccaceae bacterium]